MNKEIWLPKAETRVIYEDGELKIWDSMVMTKQQLNKSTFGFNEKEKEN